MACSVPRFCLPQYSSGRSCFAVSLLLACTRAGWPLTVVLWPALRGCTNSASAGLPWACLFSLTCQIHGSPGAMRTGKNQRESQMDLSHFTHEKWRPTGEWLSGAYTSSMCGRLGTQVFVLGFLLFDLFQSSTPWQLHFPTEYCLKMERKLDLRTFPFLFWKKLAYFFYGWELKADSLIWQLTGFCFVCLFVLKLLKYLEVSEPLKKYKNSETYHNVRYF